MNPLNPDPQTLHPLLRKHLSASRSFCPSFMSASTRPQPLLLDARVASSACLCPCLHLGEIVTLCQTLANAGEHLPVVCVGGAVAQLHCLALRYSRTRAHTHSFTHTGRHTDMHTYRGYAYASLCSLVHMPHCIPHYARTNSKASPESPDIHAHTKSRSLSPGPHMAPRHTLAHVQSRFAFLFCVPISALCCLVPGAAKTTGEP